MPSSHEDGSTPERDLQDTRDDLAQASIALNTAYDRLQGLRASLRSFTADTDRLSGIRRPHHQARLHSDESMRPEHSAIVLSDSEEESEVDMETLRESLPSRLLELTSRWGNQHARLTAAARQVTETDTRTSSSALSSSVASSDEPRLVYPPLARRRRPLPPATSSLRDGGFFPPPNVLSPVRVGMLEAHMRELRRLRRASSPSDSSTTLGQRVAQRQAAASERSGRRAHGPDTGAPSESIVRSTLPLGLEPRPTPPPRSYGSTNLLSIESRAATHLRHSLLPTPPAGIRLGMPTRASSTNGTHARFNDRLERTRTARSNSLTAVSRGSSPTPTVVQDNHTLDASTQSPPSPRSRGTNAWEEPSLRSAFLDSTLNYPTRRRVRAQSSDEPRDTNWSEVMLQRNGDDLLDAPTWLRPHLRQILRVGSRSSRAQPEPDADRANPGPRPASSNDANAPSQERTIQRRRTRGWARLDPNGDEISTEDEADLERRRTNDTPPRNWNQNHATTWVAERGSHVLSFVYHNSRDAATGHRDISDSLEGLCDGDSASIHDVRPSHQILDDLLHSSHSVYISPLPVQLPHKRTRPRVVQCPNEVRVPMDSRLAGR